MAIKAINDIINYNKLIFTLLVYRVYLKINNLNSFILFIINRVIII
jgi:hypothetical protein